jgi:hypothetical protein
MYKLTAAWILPLLLCLVAACIDPYGGLYGRTNKIVLSDVTVDPSATVLATWVNDFNGNSNGFYTETLLDADWNNPEYNQGVEENRVEIITCAEIERVKTLQVLYPGNVYGIRDGGAQWPMSLGDSYNSFYCAYKIKFTSGFDFARGGKIPGLGGGDCNTVYLWLCFICGETRTLTPCGTRS